MSINFIQIEGTVGAMAKGEGFATFLLLSQKAAKNEAGESIRVESKYQVFAYGELAGKASVLENTGYHVSIKGVLETENFGDGSKVPVIKAYSISVSQNIDQEALDQNTVILSGRASVDVSFDTKAKRANFSIANTKAVKNGDSFVNETNYFKCVAFGSTAERLAKQVSKGTFLCVNARLDANEWTDKDGNAQMSVSLIIDRFDSVKPSQKADQMQGVSMPNLFAQMNNNSLAADADELNPTE